MTLVVGAVAEAVAESVAEAEAVLLGVAVLSAVEVAEVPRPGENLVRQLSPRVSSS